MTDFGLFLGRFHPVLVHLPIGFLLLATLMEWLKSGEKGGLWQQAVRFAWFWGATSATLAAFVGWLLANHGAYFETDLFWHRWMGIGVAALGWIGWYGKRRMGEGHFLSSKWMAAIVAGLLTLTGHLGGNLTHGRGYLLEHAPFVAKAGKDTIQTEFPALDSIRIYRDLIEPVVAGKCFDCHNEEQKRGGFAMDSPEGMEEGGDHGAVLVSGKPYESELLTRVTLPRNDRLFMPPKGTPMTYQEVRLLEWWINDGADFDGRLKEKEIPQSIQLLLLREYGLDLEPKPLVETIKVGPAAPELLEELAENGYRVNTLAQTNNLLEVKYKGDTVNREALEHLLQTKEQVTRLDLGRVNITDEMLQIIGQLPNLTRLRLQQNPITDAGIRHLEELINLESLNLYGTGVSDEALASIRKMPNLKRLYLWQTEVTPEGLEALKQDKPELEANLGFQF